MPGFTLAIASMQPGERAIFTIPPEFAVTMSGGSLNIPTNQTLWLDVELISLITDIFDDQGIFIKTVKFGRGNDHPCDSDEVFGTLFLCFLPVILFLFYLFLRLQNYPDQTTNV